MHRAVLLILSLGLSTIAVPLPAANAGDISTNATIKSRDVDLDEKLGSSANSLNGYIKTRGRQDAGGDVGSYMKRRGLGEPDGEYVASDEGLNGKREADDCGKSFRKRGDRFNGSGCSSFR